MTPERVSSAGNRLQQAQAPPDLILTQLLTGPGGEPLGQIQGVLGSQELVRSTSSSSHPYPTQFLSAWLPLEQSSTGPL